VGQTDELARAINLVRRQLDKVASKNQLEHYLRAFNVSGKLHSMGIE